MQPTKNQVAAALVSVELETKLAGKLRGERVEAKINATALRLAENQLLRNEKEIKQLQRELDAERTLCLAVMRVSAAKDADYEVMEARCEALEERLSEWAGAGLAVNLWCVAALLAKIAGCL